MALVSSRHSWANADLNIANPPLPTTGRFRKLSFFTGASTFYFPNVHIVPSFKLMACGRPSGNNMSYIEEKAGGKFGKKVFEPSLQSVILWDRCGPSGSRVWPTTARTVLLLLLGRLAHTECGARFIGHSCLQQALALLHQQLISLFRAQGLHPAFHGYRCHHRAAHWQSHRHSKVLFSESKDALNQ